MRLDTKANKRHIHTDNGKRNENEKKQSEMN